jgi:hypothetical protein
MSDGSYPLKPSLFRFLELKGVTLDRVLRGLQLAGATPSYLLANMRNRSAGFAATALANAGSQHLHIEACGTSNCPKFRIATELMIDGRGCTAEVWHEGDPMRLDQIILGFELGEENFNEWRADMFKLLAQDFGGPEVGDACVPSPETAAVMWRCAGWLVVVENHEDGFGWVMLLPYYDA